MGVTPDVILGSARALGSRSAEVDWRNATSRAYYAAYHGCRMLAESLEPLVDLSNARSHKVVGDVLADHRRPNAVRALGYRLAACRRSRNQADYDIDFPFQRDVCLTVVEACGLILRDINALRDA